MLYSRTKLGFLFKRCGFLALAMGHTGSGAGIGLNRTGAGQMFEGNFAVDTPCATESSNRLGERAGHTILSGIRHRKVSVFYTMKMVYYRTSVDSDVRYDPEQFAEEIAIYLADPDGWAQYVRFVPGSGPAAKHIHLSSSNTLATNGCASGHLSCATLGGRDIWLNAQRWLGGASASRLPLERYRQYMVSHEMGHSLGYEHVKCPNSGPAPIMLQQTLGIGRCSPNTKLTKHDISISLP